MQITIKLSAVLRVGRFAALTREYQAGTTVGEIVRELYIPERELGMLLVNDRQVGPELLLHEGDILSVFPPLRGELNRDMQPYHPYHHG